MREQTKANKSEAKRRGHRTAVLQDAKAPTSHRCKWTASHTPAPNGPPLHTRTLRPSPLRRQRREPRTHSSRSKTAAGNKRQRDSRKRHGRHGQREHSAAAQQGQQRKTNKEAPACTARLASRCGGWVAGARTSAAKKGSVMAPFRPSPFEWFITTPATQPMRRCHHPHSTGAHHAKAAQQQRGKGEETRKMKQSKNKGQKRTHWKERVH